MKMNMVVNAKLALVQKLARHLCENEWLLIDGKLFQVHDVMFRDGDMASRVGIRVHNGEPMIPELIVRGWDERVTVIDIQLTGRF